MKSAVRSASACGHERSSWIRWVLVEHRDPFHAQHRVGAVTDKGFERRAADNRREWHLEAGHMMQRGIVRMRCGLSDQNPASPRRIIL